jgi:hypothetical protein
MDSGMISKIQKAGQYAQEPHRLRFERFEVKFQGNHHKYTVVFDHGQWQCGCGFFQKRGVCSHTMALEKMLGVMLPEPAVEGES